MEAAQRMKASLNSRNQSRLMDQTTWQFWAAPRAAAASSLHPEVSPAEHPSGAVTAANILRLLECQNYRCALTGRRLTPEVASLDHVVPVRDGGEHRIENSQVLHKDVNRAKSTMTSEQFIQLCREVVRHAARKDAGAMQ